MVRPVLLILLILSSARAADPLPANIELLYSQCQKAKADLVQAWDSHGKGILERGMKFNPKGAPRPKSLNDTLQRIEKLTAGFRSPDRIVYPALPEPARMTGGMIGILETEGPEDPEREFRIIQVVDEKTLIVSETVRRRGPTAFWLDGVKTTGLIDDAAFEPSEVYEVVGTKRYTDANGAVRTIRQLRAFDASKYEAEFKRRQRASSKGSFKAKDSG